MAFEYHIAAVTLWTQIVNAPYLYNPVSYLLRHTIELQLKGLIVYELKNDDSSLKVSEILTPKGKMDRVHSVMILWEYYQQLLRSHGIKMDDSEYQFCTQVLSKIDKKDFSSTRYRYPVAKNNSIVSLEPVKVHFSDIGPDLIWGIPSIATGDIDTEKIGVIKKGTHLICDTQDNL